MDPYNEEYLPPPLGSMNTGAICWLNSLMQSLLSCPVFVRRVLGSKRKLGRTEIGEALYTVVWTAMYDHDRFPYTVGLLKKQITIQKKSFGNGQECASEGLLYLLELVQGSKDYFLSNLFMHRIRCDFLCEQCRVCRSSGVDYGISLQLFQLTTPITTAEEFVANLKVHLSPSDKPCDDCGATLVRRYRLTMVPEIVIVMFNKYGVQVPRLAHYVPRQFTLPGTDGSEMIYMQVAQIEHHGSLHGGHYFAKCLRQGGVFLLNDASCSKSEFSPTSNTYIVIYNFKKNTKKSISIEDGL
jgi:ubiquitin C-terminal hydrolase